MQKIISLLLFFLSLSPFIKAQGIDTIENFILKKTKIDSIPGATLLIIKNNKIQKIFVTGYANMEHNIPTSLETIFELASVSKPFTHTATMLLADKGLIELDTSIATYLDSVPPAFKAITIRMLMNHTSGLPFDHFNYFKLAGPTPIRYTITEQLSDLFKKKPLFTPGTQYLYSNAGLFLQAAIIQKVTKIPFYQFLKEQIFDKANMKQTSFLNGDSIIPNRAQGYTIRKGKWVRASLEIMLQSLDCNAFAGFTSTVTDFHRFFDALTNQKIISSTAFYQMITPSAFTNGKLIQPRDGSSVGLGWFLKDIKGNKAFFHGGYTGTFALHFPEKKLSVLLFTNLGYGYGAITGDKGFDFTKTGLAIAELAVSLY